MRPGWMWSVVLAGCAARAMEPTARFANQPIATAVNDRRDVVVPPAQRLFLPSLYVFDGTIGRRLPRALELPRARRALGTNASDEVPDSTWFTNRIGVRALTADEIRTGPVTHDPQRHMPWTIHSTKIGGTSVGFLVKDTAGVKYMLKFDGVDDPPELQTGTHVAVNRLLWACGYNVTEDLIVHPLPSDLILAPDATVKDLTGGDERRLDRAALDRALATVQRDPDGRIRALASRWIDGVTLGGHPSEGVRYDDPNDRIPHELRRDLRGQAAIYAWLDAVDVTEGQYVDSWVVDPRDPTRHYVKHYAIDFGMSLGAMGTILYDWRRSSSYLVDFPEMVRSFLSLGLSTRPWQDRVAPRIRGVASLFDATTFDPGAWHTDWPGYVPFLMADRFDRFWGAKIVARFTREQIHAAIEAGQFSDPRAVDYITDTLIARQRKTMEYWFARVAPIDAVTIHRRPDGDELCFDDLAITARLAPASATRYEMAAYDFEMRPLGTLGDPASSDGRTCLRVQLASSRGSDGYTILKIAIRRPGFAGDTWVHVARDPGTGIPRVIGLWRA